MELRQDRPYRVAILYICTGQYVAFWEGFYESFRRNFLRGAELSFFVFTDAESLYGEQEDARIHKIPQENLGWPGNTLFRFRMFHTLEEELSEYDYTFFFNANTVCLTEITGEEFLPLEQELLVVQHPGFYDAGVWKMPYERSRKSSARIPYGKGKVYVYGAVNGGRTHSYLQMCRQLEREIEEDYQKGIIAKWHDESHLNHYIWQHHNYRLLTPSYAYPENYELPFERRIGTRDKASVIRLDQAKLDELDRRSIRKRVMKYMGSLRNERLD